MCEVDLELLEVSIVEFSFHQDLYLLEIEFYGYFSGGCLIPSEIGKGVTLSGQSISEHVLFEFDDELFNTFEEFHSSVSDSITTTSLSYLSYYGFLISDNCFYSRVPFSLNFTPSEATQIDLLSNFVEFYRQSGRLLIPVICLDSIGFVFDCVDDFSIVSSTFGFSAAELTPSYLTFYSQSGFPINDHVIELMFCGGYFNFDLTIIQNYEEFLTVEFIKTESCELQMFFENSCTFVELSILHTTQLELFNNSRYLSVFDVSVESLETQHVFSVGTTSIQIVDLPLQSVTLTLSYLDSTASVTVPIDDCVYPKINAGFGCFCVDGMYLDFTGDCSPCPVNYYSNSNFNLECRSCPFPRITLKKGSSDLDQCVCPLNTLDSLDSCLPCPHLAECGYGNLTGIEPGFRLNNISFNLEECSFWYNCESNQCRSPYALGTHCQYCTSEAIATRVYCIGKEYLLIKLFALMVFCFAIFKTDQSLFKIFEIKKKYSSQWKASDVSKMDILNILKTESKFTNYMLLFLVSVSFLFQNLYHFSLFLWNLTFPFSISIIVLICSVFY
ncbi:hypothetical protein GEMRC1_008077 [Eukaryota sp. GEM-RC1]